MRKLFPLILVFAGLAITLFQPFMRFGENIRPGLGMLMNGGIGLGLLILGGVTALVGRKKPDA